MVGWLAAAWLALVATLQLASARNRRSRAAVLADRLAPRFLRSVACQATRLSLGVAVLAPAVPLTSPPPHTAVMVPLDAEPNQAAPAEPESTSTSTTATTVAPPTSEPPSTTTTTLVPPSTTTTTTTTATASPVPPAPSDARPPVPASDEVVVRPGDSFWSIAEEEADGDVVSYWRALIDANRDRLVDPGNPDLLYPEQVLRLPAR
jgi:nucleoid-associated protein YgaU